MFFSVSLALAGSVNRVAARIIPIDFDEPAHVLQPVQSTIFKFYRFVLTGKVCRGPFADIRGIGVRRI
ncbi:exported protein of unknown function [Candidatus Filomicrobium marinum]|uniref:Uncharacterized protein n=1 Tax=Candidatus Filomicrobium marinum TaxID=1608628 RepID=A0A0D6JET1_9HYPH|nr:exported protein of unknown function [Candidatus Filomicrobium marinum]